MSDLRPDAAAGMYEFLFKGICFALAEHWNVLICNVSESGAQSVIRLLAQEDFGAFIGCLEPRLALATCLERDGFLNGVRWSPGKEVGGNA